MFVCSSWGKLMLWEKEEIIARENSEKCEERLRFKLEKKQLDMCLSLRHTSIYDKKVLSPKSKYYLKLFYRILLKSI